MSASERAWRSWRSLREIGGTFETPYHHALVEVRLPGETGTRAINPLDLPPSLPLDDVAWRPMPWAEEGIYRYFGRLAPDCIFVGEDEHLFHSGDMACEQLFEGGGLIDEECGGWIALLRRRLEWCEARGIAYRHLVIPEHHAIYPDKLPGHPELARNRPIMRVLAAADEGLRRAILYPLQTMREGRARHETSFAHDVHFTRYGAFLCYRELMGSLGYPPDQLIREDELTRREMMVAGDVAHAFGWSGRTVEWFDPPVVRARTVVKGTSFKTTQLDVFETDESSLPRLLMFRTSNATHLFPFLFRHFCRVTAVASVRMFYDLVESEMPDVVFSEMPERYFAARPPRHPDDRDLTLAPNDRDLAGFAEVTGHALPLPGDHRERARAAAEH